MLRAHLAKQQCRRPAKYLARWHVLYRDERGQVHGDIQVQAVHADLGVIDAWCPARGGVDRFTIAGLARVADAETGARIDLEAWLRRPHRAAVRSAARPLTLRPRRRTSQSEPCGALATA
jgi:hypothetical protein